jgi:anaerobic magnesium-protoporphyrin IX monomethyl ester cyclase
MTDSPEVLFTHAYFVSHDARALGWLHPLPPLQPAYVAAWTATRGRRTVEVWDPTFRAGEDAWEVAVSRLRPPIVWLYVHPTTRPEAARMAATARRAGSAVLVGGPDARLRPEFYLRAGADAVVLGEGETGTLAAVLALRAAGYRPAPEVFHSVPGVVYLDSARELRFSPGREQPVDLSELPRPFRDPSQTEIHLERWRDHRRFRPLSIESARGCPVWCGFCTNTVFGRPYRRRDPLDVVSEMGEIVEQFDVDRLVFTDEVFVFDRHWLAEFADAMGRWTGAVPFEASANPALLDADSLHLLARAGCVHIDLDAATGSQRLLRSLDWRYGTEDVYRAAGAIRDAGLGMGLRVLAGLAGETRSDLEATMEMVEMIKPDGVEVTRVDPGSPALFRKNWERVVAGPVAERSETDPPLPGPILNAAVSWMNDEGRARAGETPLFQGLKRPLLRAMVKILPGRRRRGRG